MHKSAKVGGIKCLASIKTEKDIKSIRAGLVSNKKLKTINAYSCALCDPTRARIVVALLMEDDLCVCDLANIFGVSVAAISQHLKKLRTAGLVASRKKGNTVYYFISDRSFKKFLTRCL